MRYFGARGNLDLGTLCMNFRLLFVPFRYGQIFWELERSVWLSYCQLGQGNEDRTKKTSMEGARPWELIVPLIPLMDTRSTCR